ncbi:MAG TPA: response regulator transcription factor, partial [bacterium]|nr:response regulator transcription factor [bacterium]
MHASEPYVLEALRNGAAAYVLKNSQAAHLVQAVREAAAGRRYLGPTLSERAIAAYADRAAADAGPSDAYDSLTGREREVLHLAAEGQSHREIAQRLSISPRTAEVHRANLMRKLHLHNQTDLVRYAIRRGIITEE